MTMVCIDLDVFCPETLYNEAFKVATEKDGLSAEHANATLKPDGEIDVSACLVIVFDPGSMPGVSINQTSVHL